MLLIDHFGFDSLQILEESRSSGTMKLQGVCQRAGSPNKNNRIYEKTLLEREFKNLKPLITERRLIGELDHPSGPTVSLKNASHIITEVSFKGDDAICIVELLNTPAGKVAQSLINDGVKLGISSRALGSLGSPDDKGFAKVNEDLKLITWDLVADPSTKEAFVGLNENTVLSEGETPISRKISEVIRERLIIETFKQSFVLIEDEEAAGREQIEKEMLTHVAGSEKGAIALAGEEVKNRSALRKKMSQTRMALRTKLEKELSRKLVKKAKTTARRKGGTSKRTERGETPNLQLSNNTLTIGNLDLLRENLKKKNLRSSLR